MMDDLDDVIQKIKAHGRKITNPKFAISVVRWLAYFKDLDDNSLGIMQDDRDAK